MPSKNVGISLIKTNEYKFTNITTCKFKPRTTIPELIINYSNVPLAFSGIPKLILAHKMYGFPYYDEKGVYGICGRDNFVILNKSREDFLRLKKFLSSKLFLSLTETTRYRMTYLEKELFEFIPDITKIEDFPNNITNESINTYFNINKLEIDYLNIHKKIYLLDKI